MKAPSTSASKAATGERNGEEKEAVQLMGEALNFHKPGRLMYSCKPYCISSFAQATKIERDGEAHFKLP